MLFFCLLLSRFKVNIRSLIFFSHDSSAGSIFLGIYVSLPIFKTKYLSSGRKVTNCPSFLVILMTVSLISDQRKQHNLVMIANFYTVELPYKLLGINLYYFYIHSCRNKNITLFVKETLNNPSTLQNENPSVF